MIKQKLMVVTANNNNELEPSISEFLDDGYIIASINPLTPGRELWGNKALILLEKIDGMHPCTHINTPSTHK